MAIRIYSLAIYIDSHMSHFTHYNISIYSKLVRSKKRNMNRMMISRTILAICCLAISVLLGCKGEVGYDAPPNCARLECPQYTVLHSQKDFEIRRYNDARWLVAPTIISKSYKEAASKGFRMYVFFNFTIFIRLIPISIKSNYY